LCIAYIYFCSYVAVVTIESQVSARWKRITEEQKAIYVEMETRDRVRFKQESAEADARVEEIQRQRRNNLVAQEGEDASQRGARAKIAAERAEDEHRRMER